MPATWRLSAAPLSSCRVLAFNGEDSLLRGYAFDLLLSAAGVSGREAPKILDDLIGEPLITLTGALDSGQTFARHGLSASAAYLFTEGGVSVFRATLRPRAHKLDLTAHSRIFLNMTLPQIIARTLKEEGFSAGGDFVDDLKAELPARPYTCQYNESSANFIRRHLERLGAYSFIRQKEGGDALVLADGEPEKLPLRDDLTWGETRGGETVSAFSRLRTAVPTKVTLRDYSTEQPGLTVKSAEDAQRLKGGGEINQYAGYGLFGELETEGQGFAAEDAAAAAGRLAAARLRALTAKAWRAEGESGIPWLQAGYAVTLDGEAFHILSVRHSASLAEDEMEERLVRRARQAGFIAGAAQGYRNAFACHPLELGPYAPECETPRPVLAGLVHAQVDAGGDGQYAELDKRGRYKVRFFFPEKVFHADADDPSDGNRSIPLRMAQAHAGRKSGIHFPLLKGTEVLAAFTDGDPDRPVILSALPNPETPSVVADENQQTNIIGTPGGHKISLTDTEGQKNLTMETPGGHKIIMDDQGGRQELRLQSGEHYIRLKKM